MANSKSTVETETKITLSEASLENVFDVLKPKDPKNVKPKHYPRDYYDTKDLKLNDQHVCIRMQFKQSKGYEQTIKAPVVDAATGHSLTRREWKFIANKNAPDFNNVSDKEALKTISIVKESKLKHIFTSDVPRRFFEMAVTLPDGQTGVVEMAFDIGEIYLADKYKKKLNCNDIDVVCEVEVEYVSGDARVVDQVVQEILQIADDAKISTVTKAERGFNLYKRAKQMKKEL